MKKNYRRLKDNFRMMESTDELNEKEDEKLKPITLIEKIMEMHKLFLAYKNGFHYQRNI